MKTLSHIEEIISLVKENGLSDTFFKEAQAHIDAVAMLLHTTPVQTVIFSLMLEHFGEYSVGIDELADSLKCKKIQMIRYMEEIEGLKRNKLVRETSLYRNHSKENSVDYTIPLTVIDSVRKDIEYKAKNRENLSPIDYFDCVDDLFYALKEDDIDRDILNNELKELNDKNQNVNFVKKQNEHNLDNSSMLIMLNLCCAFVCRDEEKIEMDNFENILDRNDFRFFKRGLKSHEHDLFKKGFVEYDFQKGLFDTEYCHLSQKAKDEFLADVEIKISPKTKDKSLILSGKINAKKLFYNEKIQARINELSSLLKDDNFSKIQERLSENGMRTGFACIFTGPPGTGKTETVYQIARETGRDILLVNISETKSCWFGESEKLIKGVFDQYRTLVKENDNIPILLFNEADAVLGKRREISDARSGVDQTENAIQNIILQEMEDLNGILIATTNMTANLDKAFERRFLYKIEFDKPDVESKKKIWQSHISTISEQDAGQLAVQFDFSGGQIENIARKSVVSLILNGKSPCLSDLLTLCKEEQIEKSSTKIGFLA
jgi:hypothetical protein